MLSVGAFLALAGPASAGSAPSGNVVDVAIAASKGGAFDKNPRDYDVLVQAVLAAGLDDDLATASAVTVFAPNDRAFKRLAKDLTGEQPRSERAAFNAIAGALATLDPNGDPIPLLTQVLLYHVVLGEALDPLEVLRSESLTMGNGGTVGVGFLQLIDQEPDLRDPRFVLPKLDIQASNGVIHTIDRILIPADLP
jgi:uncharacterized surface protein with fasciclin (FAS1) repeats